jgi:hypothetical protein
MEIFCHCLQSIVDEVLGILRPHDLWVLPGKSFSFIMRESEILSQ